MIPDPGYAWPLVIAAAVGYLLGSIPFGLILTRLAGLGDIRRIGSGNIGATNVLRTGNKGLAALTLFLDGAKGALAAVLGAQFGPDTAWFASLGAVLGHVFPVWLRFRGGKGVATAMGVLLGAAWPVGLLTGATWPSAWRRSMPGGLRTLSAPASLFSSRPW
jgi:glycerol-3-phosphate acyltransferase PlsY